MSKKKTVGSHAKELLEKEPESRDPIELEREMHKDYEKNVHEAIDRGKKEFDDDFYVVVTTKKERLMKNVIRNYFHARQTCPTPDYDQTVYCYSIKHELLEFLWVLPSKDTCQLLKDNALQVASDEKALLHFVLSFYDGSLLVKAKKLNGEQLDSPLLDNKEGRSWKKTKN